jgi:hypothetical protein
MAEITHLVIANRACALIGQEPLQSLDEDTLGGQRAALIYDSLLDFCMALTPWTFRRETVELNRLPDAPLIDGQILNFKNGYRYLYTIPQGYKIKPNRLLRSNDPEDVLVRFEFEGDKLYCDETRAFAQLLIEQHPERWAGDFRHAFTVALSGEFALAMADDKQVSGAKKDEAFGSSSQNFRGGLMGAAIQNDARSSPVRKLPLSNPLLDSWMS